MDKFFFGSSIPGSIPSVDLGTVKSSRHSANDTGASRAQGGGCRCIQGSGGWLGASRAQGGG